MQYWLFVKLSLIQHHNSIIFNREKVFRKRCCLLNSSLFVDGQTQSSNSTSQTFCFSFSFCSALVSVNFTNIFSVFLTYSSGTGAIRWLPQDNESMKKNMNKALSPIHRSLIIYPQQQKAQPKSVYELWAKLQCNASSHWSSPYPEIQVGCQWKLTWSYKQSTPHITLEPLLAWQARRCLSGER